ncbi:rhodanese-like domain-containing protein 4, chloroplastic [Rosa sericea]
MEALNAASLTPISVLGDRKKEPRKFPSLPSISLPKFSSSTSFSTKASQEGSSKSFHGGLLLLSSVFNAGFAKALTYEEALGQAVSTANGDFDSSGALDNVISFVNDNPAIIAGGFAILAVPLVLSQVLKNPKPFGVESAKSAYAKLGEDANAFLVDVRAPGEIRQVGSPDIRGLGKKSVPIVYKGEDKPGFLKKLSLKFKEPENTALFILDKFDGNSELVAELVTVNGFKAAYAIKDGAEGPRGWVSSGLPWIPPPKALSVDFGSLADTISGAVGEGSGALSVSLGIAAATGLGLLAFTEVRLIKTILQLLGSAALVQFASTKLLFAEDRNKTLQEVDSFLTTKVAPKELLDDIKQIGIALLPVPVISKALPAPEEASPAPTAADTGVKAEAAPEPKVEAAAEPPPEINSVPKAEVKKESFPGISKSLSPFPYYPDFKPPTSPRPSQP